ncbi:hypothetical protein RISK_003341 [Rhodopirellula islandica]|uniref:Uncharacterized protein n=1 Tax=Rhodopirellula islandica TaxID=595434 RepID=A0A0J1EGQ0_RHOIS|nr:hypothetical protein RISK_003341 [Rhodopirellula islandica]
MSQLFRRASFQLRTILSSKVSRDRVRRLDDPTPARKQLGTTVLL